MSYFTVKNIHKTWETVTVDFSLECEKGTMTCLLGPSGCGKSTLINAVIGKEVAKVGTGKHGTEKMEPYVSDDLNFQLIDSRGFEYNFWNTRKAVKDMKTWLADGLKDKKPRIHMLWFCVDATSKRFTKQTMKTVEEVKKEWKEVPIIVVLTKSFFIAEDEDNIEMVKETFRRAAKRTGMPIAIIPVLAQPPKGENILPRGIEELIEVTEKNLDAAVRDAEQAVKRYDLKCKRRKAQALTFAAATSGGAIGAIPISFPDTVILTPLETLLVTSISRVYNLDEKDDLIKKIITRLVEAGTVSFVAKNALNQLKKIPGLGNLAADALNAIVAGAIIAGIGEATSLVMEKVYLGDINKEDLEWVNNIVENQMNVIIKNISNFVTGKKTNLNSGDILKALFSKKET